MSIPRRWLIWNVEMQAWFALDPKWTPVENIHRAGRFDEEERDVIFAKRDMDIVSIPEWAINPNIHSISCMCNGCAADL